MPWIIDTDLLIEGERGDAGFIKWLGSVDSVATADIIRAEFLLGVHAVNDEALRTRGSNFIRARLRSFPR
jgi:predicted nucleic acid-binding protein